MRTAFMLAALAMLGWIVTGTVLWLGQYGDPAHAVESLWYILQADWMLLVLLTDMLIFTAAVFLWVGADLRARGAAWPTIVAWLAPMLVLGSVVLFVYLARRPGRPPAPSPVA